MRLFSIYLPIYLLIYLSLSLHAALAPVLQGLRRLHRSIRAATRMRRQGSGRDPRSHAAIRRHARIVRGAHALAVVFDEPFVLSVYPSVCLSIPLFIHPTLIMHRAILIISQLDLMQQLLVVVLQHGQIQLTDVRPVARHFEVLALGHPRELGLRAAHEGDQRVEIQHATDREVL